MPGFFTELLPSAPSGKNDRWLVNFLTLAALVYGLAAASSYVLNSDLLLRADGPRIATSFLMLVALGKALLVQPDAPVSRAHAALVIALLFVVSCVNIAVSWDPMQSAARWALWFSLVLALTRVARSTDGSWVEATIRRLPYLFVIIYFCVILTVSRGQEQDVVASAYHLSGLYGNLILATGLFARRVWQRAFWMMVGLVAIYFSGSGGALFTIPIMFIPFIMYSATSMPVKGFTVAIMLALGSLFFIESDLFTSFLDIKLHIAPGEEEGSYTGMDRLEHSKEVRLALVQWGLATAAKYPLGTGLGHTYDDLASEEVGIGHVHDGMISMLIELGMPGFAVAISSLLWVFSSILRNPMIGGRIKGFYFTYYFTILGRSLSENYTPFDLGNMFNVVFLLLTCYLFLYPRRAAAANPTNGSMRRPMMMPAPRPRGRPVPHPVGLRG